MTFKGASCGTPPRQIGYAVKISDSTGDIQKRWRNHHGSDLKAAWRHQPADCHRLRIISIKKPGFSTAGLPELCRGDLLEFIDRMSLADRVKIAYALLNTLAYLHHKRTSHRDDKLNNLLLTRTIACD